MQRTGVGGLISKYYSNFCESNTVVVRLTPTEGYRGKGSEKIINKSFNRCT